MNKVMQINAYANCVFNFFSYNNNQKILRMPYRNRCQKFAALERTGSEFCCRPGMIRCTTPTQTDSDGRAGSGGDFGESVRTGRC